MVVSVLVAALIVLASAKSYKSFTDLWVDSAAPAPSSLGASALSLGAGVSPATQEQGVLNELLATRSFVLAVGHGSALGSSLPGNHSGSSLTSSGRSPVDAKIISAVSKNVTSLVEGPQVLQITFSGPTPAVARSALDALVRQLQSDSAGFIAQHNQSALSYYRSQLATANQALTTARNQVTAYLGQHPGATAGGDPNLGVLTGAEAAASTQLLQANTALNQAAGGGWNVQVIDPPANGLLATSRNKQLLAIFGGLLAGAMISFLGTIALTPGRREYWEDELPKALPNGASATTAHAGAARGAGGRQLSTTRRLIVASRDGPDAEQRS
jgi:hypothetical protein